MRLPITVAVVVLLVPASAHAATVGREGTELVYRAAAGQEDRLGLADDERSVRFSSGNTALAAGTGCEAMKGGARCAVAGVTAIRVLAADADDSVDAELGLPLIVDLGAGDDQLAGHVPSIVLTAGEGDDYTDLRARSGTFDMGPGDDDVSNYGVDGPLQVLARDGDDRLDLLGKSGPGTTVSGGAGNDFIVVQVEGSTADIACGPGADRVHARLADRLGDGCAPQLTGITPKTVSRVFREGALGAPAGVSVTLRRASQRTAIARGTADAPAGPVRMRLKTTAAGRRWLRRDPRMRLIVTVRTHSGGDRGEVEFASRLEP